MSEAKKDIPRCAEKSEGSSDEIPRISKAEINQLAVRQYDGRIVVVRSQERAAHAIAELARETVLGFDTETRPAFRKNQQFLPSLLQLAGEHVVYIFQLRQLTDVAALFGLLANPHVIKAGVALDYDVKQLRQLYDFTPAGFIELSTMADRCGIGNNGLRGLAAYCFGFRISKRARCSNWSRRVLSKEQIDYAATDAWVSRKLYLHLRELLASSDGGGGLQEAPAP